MDSTKELPEVLKDDYIFIEGAGYFPKILSQNPRKDKYMVWEKEDQLTHIRAIAQYKE